MGTSTCPRCGDTFVYGHDGDDPFTSVSVSHHDDSREDFAISVCQDCGDEVLDDLYHAADAHPRQ